MPRRNPRARGRTAFDVHAEAVVPADAAHDSESESESYYSSDEERSSEYESSSSRSSGRGRRRSRERRPTAGQLHRERLQLIRTIEDYRRNEDLAVHIPPITYTTSLQELRDIEETCIQLLEDRQAATSEASFLNLCENAPLWAASTIQWVNLRALSPKRQLAFDDLNRQTRIAVRNKDFAACQREIYRRYFKNWFGGLATNPIVAWLQIMVTLCVRTHTVSTASYDQGATDPRKVRAREQEEAAKAAAEEGSETGTTESSEEDTTPAQPMISRSEPWAPKRDYELPPTPTVAPPEPAAPAPPSSSPDDFVLDIPDAASPFGVTYPQIDFNLGEGSDAESGESDSE